jgi:hypothetical protein
MTDQELVLEALEQAQQILARYVEPGPRNERATLEALLTVLDRRDVVAAIDRLRSGYGLRVVK